MEGELEPLVRRMFDALADGDLTPVLDAISDDAQAIDELTRTWLRGGGSVRDYAKNLVEVAKGVDTRIRDVQEILAGDVGVLTCWIEQDYTLEGEPQHVSAPTSVVFRREDGEWRFLLFHSVPLGEET
jgi:ketosteroid isomerase-like protein